MLVILTKGGSALKIRKVGIMSFGFGLLPLCTNVLGIGMLFYFLLDAPYHVSIMAGTCVAGIAPAVALPLGF